MLHHALKSIALVVAVLLSACGADAGTGGVSQDNGGADEGAVADAVDASPGDASVPLDRATADGSAAEPADTERRADLAEDAAPPPIDDRDGDGIPDDRDPLPDDPTMPGISHADFAYAHTSGVLFSFDTKTLEVARIGTIQWPQDRNDHRMSDLAIDAVGVLYGITPDALYACHPISARCALLAALPDGAFFNGMTFIPPGILHAEREVLIGIAGDGGWHRIDLDGGAVSVVKLGDYGPAYDSSGDAFSIRGVGTFAAVNKLRPNGTTEPVDYFVEVDPLTGAVLREVGPIPGYHQVFGLAGGVRQAWAFDESGDVIVIDIATGAVADVVRDTGHRWWGAGVRTLVR